MSQPASWRPSHAYIPGQTLRHDEALFDFLKADIAQCETARLPGTSAWLHAMAFIDEGYYWEAHEVLEAVWMRCPENSPEKLYVQSVIQQANAALKRKMGQAAAAARIETQVQALRKEAVIRSGGSLFDGAISL